MSTATFVQRAFVGLFVVGCIVSSGISAYAAETQMKFFGQAAREIKLNLDSGNGWCIVSARESVRLLDDPNVPAVECLKYRVVTAAQFTKDSNGEASIVLTLGEETPWISVEFNTPKASCPSMDAAKAANEAIGNIDAIVSQLGPVVSSEENTEVRAAGLKVLGLLRAQRAALADLIAKDIRTTEMAK